MCAAQGPYCKIFAFFDTERNSADYLLGLLFVMLLLCCCCVIPISYYACVLEHVIVGFFVLQNVLGDNEVWT